MEERHLYPPYLPIFSSRLIIPFFLLYRLQTKEDGHQICWKSARATLLPSPKKARRMGFCLACPASKASLFCPLCKSNLSVRISLGFILALLHSTLLFLSVLTYSSSILKLWWKSAHTPHDVNTPHLPIIMLVCTSKATRQFSSFRNWDRRTEWVPTGKTRGRGADPLSYGERIILSYVM